MKLAFATPSTALVALTCMLHSSAALPASSSVLQRREATGTVTPMCYTVDKEQDGVKSVEYKLSVAWPTLVEPKAPSTVRVAMLDTSGQPKVLYEVPGDKRLAAGLDMFMVTLQYVDSKITGSGISWASYDDIMKNGAAATVVAGTEPLDLTGLPGKIEFTVASSEDPSTAQPQIASIDILKDCKPQ